MRNKLNGGAIRRWVTSHPVPTAIGVGGAALVTGVALSAGIGLLRADETATRPSPPASQPIGAARSAAGSASPTPSPTQPASASAAPTPTPQAATPSPSPMPDLAPTPIPSSTPTEQPVALLPGAVPGVGRIAWSTASSSESGSDIVVAAGTVTVRVAATAAEESNPVWSPDGERLAYISSAAGGSVVVLGPNGKQVVHEGSYPRSSYYTDGIAWSPDSTRLALALVPDRVRIVDLDGDTLHDFGVTAPRHVAWSPSGDLVAFTSGRDLMVVDVATGATRIVVAMDSNVRFPMWLPDGQTIVFHGYTEALNTDLFAIALDGTGLRNLTATSDLYEDAPAISPDRTRIAMVVEDGAERWVEVMNTDGSARTRTVQDLESLGAPAWSPDGTRLVVADGDAIFEVPVEPGLPSFLIGDGVAPSWGRDPE